MPVIRERKMTYRILAASLAVLILSTTAYAQPAVPGHGGTGCPNPIEVGDLDDYDRSGALCMVSDGEDASDCTTGGGSTVTLCCYADGAWSACGGGGDSAGDVEAIGDCVSGSCFTSSGTGASLTFEGATPDEFHTILSATDPTDHGVIVLPNETGTLCTSAATAPCTDVFSETDHTHSADIVAVGDCATDDPFVDGTCGNSIKLGGTSLVDGFEIELKGAASSADFVVTVPAETGTLCTSTGTTSGCGKVNGPDESENRGIATYSGTDGDNLRDNDCTIVDTDGDANALGDQIICPGGFSATDRGSFDEENALTIIDNDTSITDNPSCDNDCEAGELCLIDTTEGAGDTWEWCEGTTELGLFVGGNESVFFGTGAMSVDATQCAAPTEVTINSGPKIWTTECADNDAASIYGNINMPDSYSGGTVTFELQGINLNATPSGITEFDFACQCRSDGDAVNSTYGTEIAAAITWNGSQYDEEHATTAATTCNGTCAAGDTLYWRAQLDATASTTTQAADIQITGVKMEFPVALIAD
jgi:hypothetical protein